MRIARGFGLVDMMIAIAIIGILFVASLPTGSAEEQLRLLAASRALTGDLSYAQSLSIANPDDPISLVIADGGVGYQLEAASAPGEAILRPGVMPGEFDGPYRVVFGEGDFAHMAGLTLKAGHKRLTSVGFDQTGALSLVTGDVGLILEGGAGQLALGVSASTGSVSIFDPSSGQAVPGGGPAEPEPEDDPKGGGKGDEGEDEDEEDGGGGVVDDVVGGVLGGLLGNGKK